MPSREGGEEDEGEESQDNGDDEKVWEDDRALERLSDPDEVERVLVDRDEVCKSCCVLIAQPSGSSSSYADSEVSHSYVEVGITNDVCNGCCDSGIDLCR